MASKEIRHTEINEICNAAELLRLAQEVQHSQQPTVLTQDGEELVEVRPAKSANAASKRRVKGKPTYADDPLWSIIGIAADPTDKVHDVSSNTDEYLAQAYEDRHL